MLSIQDGVLSIAWANRAFSDLLGLDPTQTVGHSLRRMIDRDPDGDPLPEPPDDRNEAWLASENESTEGREPAGAEIQRGVPAQRPAPAPTPGWAQLAHQLLRSGHGSGMGQVHLPDGRRQDAHVVVIPVGSDLAAAPASATVPAAGTVGALSQSAPPSAWLIAIEPVVDRLADLETALAVAENRFAALAGCAPVGIFASDVGARLGYVNDRFVGLTGRNAHALLGNGWLDAVHGEDLPALYTAIQTVLSGTPVELAVRWAGAGDVHQWMQLRLAPTTTPTRAAGFIGTAEDVTSRRSWEEHITYQAQHDALTGLVNRRRLMEVLRELMSGRRHRDRDFAVLFLDVDGFKDVNDTHGHDAGDRALIEISRRLQRAARATDLVARVAGDEFVVVLRHISADEEAEAAARRYSAALSTPVQIGGVEVALTASLGVALPSGFDTPEMLLQAADRVMYEAKAAGPGGYRLTRVKPMGEQS